MKLANSDYDKIMRDYDSKQYKSNLLQAERRRELYTKIPALKEIDDKLTSLSADLAKKVVFLDPTEYEVLSGKVFSEKEELQNKKKELLKSHHYPLDYLTKVYECNDCKDTGYISGKKCHCFESAIIRLLKNREDLSKIPENALFSLFNPDYYSADDFHPETETSSRENALNVLNFAKNYVLDFENSKKNILIYGNTGTGKTFLSGCIANALCEKGYSISFVTAFRFFNVLEQYAFQKNNPDFLKMRDNMEFMLNCDLLVIDDIGTESTNNFTQIKLYEFINERILEQKPTVITTNHDPFYITKIYGERIFSRISGNYKFIKLTGEDIRMIKRNMDLS